MPNISARSIAIIGGGFSGTMAAVHLLRAELPYALSIFLLEDGEVGRGLAYSTTDARHLLNVPSGSMSALEEDSQHFLNYLRKRFGEAASADFAPRQVYGDYLQSILQEAIAGKRSDVDFQHIRTRAVDSQASGDRHSIRLANGAELDVDRIILATGNAASKLPVLHNDFFVNSARFIQDPWSENFLDRVDWQKPLLLIGTGLTAVDIILKLAGQRFEPTIYALSRRGLQPMSHRGLSGKLDLIDMTQLHDQKPLSISDVARFLRARFLQVIADGRDWRDIIAAIRPKLPSLWQQFSLANKRRFLRHAAVYWDVHRHRLAPPVAAALQDILVARRLKFLAGRIVSISEQDSVVEVLWSPRGKQARELLRVGTVVNCTGPNGDVQTNSDPLVKALLRRGVIKQDEVRLGIEVDDHYSVVNKRGEKQRSIFYVGPWLKAKYWEATSVPELKTHVQRAVRNVLDSLAKSN